MSKRLFRRAARAAWFDGSRNKYILELGGDVLTRQIIVSIEVPEIQRRPVEICLTGNLLTIKDATAERVKCNTFLCPEIIGASDALSACLEQAAEVASSHETVLLSGETGTGKELLARAIHQNSSHRRQPFIVLDCRAFPDELAEEVLFGGQRNGRSRQAGLLAQAAGGTLFLDEIADLSHFSQQWFQQIFFGDQTGSAGHLQPMVSRCRLIVATNRNLELLVKEQKFNRSLLEQMQPKEIGIPPLRLRLTDLDLLATHFLEQGCRKRSLECKRLSPEVMDLMQKYPWPGNVRELKNSLEQALLAATNQKTLFPKDMPSHIRIQVKKASFSGKEHSSKYRQPQAFQAGALLADSPV